MHEKAYQQHGAAWTMPAEWKPARGFDVPVMKLLVQAYRREGKERDDLDQISAAIQAWPHGEGQHDDLTADRLRQHFLWSDDERVRKAGHAAARLRRALIPVAVLVKRKYAELQKVLRLDLDAEPPPTMVQKNRTLARRAEDAELRAEAEVKRRKAAENKVSQYSKRLKSKCKAATDARRAEHKKMSHKHKAEKKAIMARARAGSRERRQGVASKPEARPSGGGGAEEGSAAAAGHARGGARGGRARRRQRRAMEKRARRAAAIATRAAAGRRCRSACVC